MDDSLRQKGCDGVCTQKSQFTRHARQREPERRSPARSAAKAERSECRGGTLFTRVRVILRLGGGGGRVDVNQPRDATRVHLRWTCDCFSCTVYPFSASSSRKSSESVRAGVSRVGRRAAARGFAGARRAREERALGEQEPRCWVPMERESLSGVFSWMRVLLRASDAPVPRVRRRHRLRSADRGEAEHRREAPGGARKEVVAARADRIFRQHRLLPTDRGALRAHTRLSRGMRCTRHSSHHHHQGEVGSARCRCLARASGRCWLPRCLEHSFRQRRRRARNRTVRQPAEQAVRDTPHPVRCRNRHRGRGRPDHPGAERRSDPRDPSARPRGWRLGSVQDSSSSAARGRPDLRGAACRRVPAPKHQGHERDPRHARRANDGRPFLFADGGPGRPMGCYRRLVLDPMPATRPRLPRGRGAGGCTDKCSGSTAPSSP